MVSWVVFNISGGWVGWICWTFFVFWLCLAEPSLLGISHDADDVMTTTCSKTITGWWLTNPSEKYEFVSWDYEIPNICKVIKAMFQTTNPIRMIPKFYDVHPSSSLERPQLGHPTFIGFHQRSGAQTSASDATLGRPQKYSCHFYLCETLLLGLHAGLFFLTCYHNILGMHICIHVYMCMCIYVYV